MTITNEEYALLSAWANAPMTGSSMSNDSGQPIENMILPSGWEVVNISLGDMSSAVSQITSGSVQNYYTSISQLDGFGGYVFKRMVDGAPEVVIAYRGTELLGIGNSTTWADIWADLHLVAGAAPSQAYHALAFYMAAMNVTGVSDSNISLTGHSLGGALASIIANLVRATAVVFDPAPNTDASTELANHFIVSGTSGSADITRIISEGDPISITSASYGGGMLGSTTSYKLNFEDRKSVV